MHWSLSFEAFAEKQKQSSIGQMLNKSNGMGQEMTRTYKCRAGLIQLPVLKTGQHPKECSGADFVNTGKWYTTLGPIYSKSSLHYSKQR